MNTPFPPSCAAVEKKRIRADILVVATVAVVALHRHRVGVCSRVPLGGRVGAGTLLLFLFEQKPFFYSSEKGSSGVQSRYRERVPGVHHFVYGTVPSA